MGTANAARVLSLEEDREAVTVFPPTKCAEKCRFSLIGPASVKTIARRSCERAVCSGYDNDDSARPQPHGAVQSVAREG
jgi:hypothetical protein